MNPIIYLAPYHFDVREITELELCPEGYLRISLRDGLPCYYLISETDRHSLIDLWRAWARTQLIQANQTIIFEKFIYHLLNGYHSANYLNHIINGFNSDNTMSNEKVCNEAKRLTQEILNKGII